MRSTYGFSIEFVKIDENIQFFQTHRTRKCLMCVNEIRHFNKSCMRQTLAVINEGFLNDVAAKSKLCIVRKLLEYLSYAKFQFVKNFFEKNFEIKTLATCLRIFHKKQLKLLRISSISIPKYKVLFTKTFNA